MISAEILRRYPYFAGIGEDTLKAIAAVSEEKSCSAGQVLFKEHDPATHLYVVTHGEADIKYTLHGGEEVIVDTVVAGDLLCWSAVIEPHKSTASAVARTDASLVSIQAGGLRKLCDQDPVLGYRLMTQVAKALSNRLDGARVQLATG